MAKRPVLAANWKMNHGPSAANGFMQAFVTHFSPQHERRIIFFPPALSLHAASCPAIGRSDITFGVQNIAWADRGAFTGELSAPMAHDAGASFALVGHSERRHIFGETDAQVADKCAAAERAGLTPLLCVGETLEQREAGETEPVVVRQLLAGLARLSQPDVTMSLIAYEPVWAIGTGRTASPDDAARVHTILRRALGELLGDRATRVDILYGGSVTAENARALLEAPDVDGLLVGGASLDVKSWVAICRS